METYSNEKDIVSLVEWATAELLQRQPADPLGFLQKLVTRAVQTRAETETKLHATLLNRTYMEASALEKDAASFTPDAHSPSFPLTLIYYAQRGLADLPFLLIHYGNVEASVRWVDPHDANILKRLEQLGDAPWSKLPALKSGPLVINERTAIVGFLAKVAGVMPSDPREAAVADAVVEHLANMKTDNIFWAQSAAEQESALENVMSMVLPQCFVNILKVAAPGAKYLCGDQVSYADLALLAEVDALVRWGTTVDRIFADTPHLKAVVDRVKNLRKVREFTAQFWEKEQLRMRWEKNWSPPESASDKS